MKSILTYCACSLVLLFFSAEVSAQDVDWFKLTSGPQAFDQKLHANADIVVGGSFNGTVDFDPGAGTNNLTSNNSSFDCFVQRFDSTGNFIWAKGFGGLGNDYVFALGTDPNGHTYVAGTYEDSMDLDPGIGVHMVYASCNSKDVFVLKLNPSGNFEWGISSQCTASSPQSLIFPHDIHVSQSGEVNVVGGLRGTYDLDPSPTAASILSAGSSGVFVWRLSPLGALDKLLFWNNADAYGGAANVTASLSCMDDYDNFYLIGQATGNFDPDPGPGVGTVSGNGGNFVIKLSSNDDFQWAKGFGATGPIFPGSICAKDSDKVYYSGAFMGDFDMDPGPGMDTVQNPQTWEDLFIISMDGNGDYRWGHSIGGMLDEKALYSVLDDRGTLYLTGHTAGDSIDFDPGPGVDVHSFNSRGGYIWALDSSGNHLWAHSFSSLIGNGYPAGLSCDARTGLHFSGTGSGEIDFQPGPDTVSNVYSATQFAFLVNYDIPTCAFLTAQFDSLKPVTCNAPGFLAATALGGHPPYAYSWPNQPSLTDSFITVPLGGWEPLHISDSLGCSRDFLILIDSPAAGNNLDMAVNLIVPNYQIGFNQTIQVQAFNLGCLPASGPLQLILDTDLDYVTASPSPTLVTGNILTWILPPLTADSVPFQASVTVTPGVNAQTGNSACNHLTFPILSGEVDTLNNSASFCSQIGGSHDPNDKQVIPQGDCEPGYIPPNQSLTYSIRFQNTGSAPAANVHILDTLSPFLSPDSLHILAHSHPGLVVELLPGNVVKFGFQNIFLPDSASDPLGSQGFVVFRLDQKPTVSDGDVIENRVGIYFDFNPPVVTNTVRNTIASTLPGTASICGPDSVCAFTQDAVFRMCGVHPDDSLWWSGLGAASLLSSSLDSALFDVGAGGYAAIVGHKQNPCGTTSDTIELFLPPTVTVDLGPDVMLCPNDSVLLTASPSVASTFLWSDGSSGPSIWVAQGGSYWLEAMDSCGISFRDSLEALPDPLQNALDLGPDTVICAGQSLLLDAGNGFSSFLWQDGSQQQSFLVSTPGTYHVTTQSPFNCSYSDTVVVDLCIGIHPERTMEPMAIYPNPNEGTFRLDLGRHVEAVGIVIFDLQGKQVHAEHRLVNGREMDLALTLPKGMYMVKVNGDGKSAMGKVLIN